MRAPPRVAAGLLAAALLAGLAGCGGSAPHAHSSSRTQTTTAQTSTIPPAPAQRTGSFGPDVSAMFLTHTDAATIDRALAAAAADGFGVARAAPLWEFTEPSPPRAGRHVYDWSFDDFVAGRLAAYGFKWIAVLAYAPGWASLEPSELHGAPRDPADFAAYAAAVAARYRGQIAAYEIWNEENSGLFWRPKPDPSSYARLYLTARAAIHRADPGVPVLIGGLANDTTFLSQLLARPGFAGQVDGVAIHPYGANPLQVLLRVRDYRLQLRSLGAGGVPLYVTEYGWATQPPGNPHYASAADQGPFIADVARALVHSDCDVRSVIFYAWSTPERDPADINQWYGVAQPSGAPTPATGVLREAARDLLAGGGAPLGLCGS